MRLGRLQLSSVGSGFWLTSGTSQCQHVCCVGSSDLALRGPCPQPPFILGKLSGVEQGVRTRRREVGEAAVEEEEYAGERRRAAMC